MTALLKNLVQETANAPGTAISIPLAGPPAGRLSFAVAFGNGGVCFYGLTDGVQSEWGIGTVTAGTPNLLARTTVLGNTLGTTARLNFTGACTVFNEVPAERVATSDDVTAAITAAVAGRVVPVSQNYGGNFPLTVSTAFLYCSIPIGTRYIWLNGYVRGVAPGGALDLTATATLRNAEDTATAVDLGQVGAATVAAGGSIVLPLSMAWDLGAPLTGTRTMRLSSATSNGQTLNLYEYRAALGCGKE